LLALAGITAFVITAIVVSDNPFGIHTVHTSTGRVAPPGT
jgi:hypothetical protein